MTFIKSALVKSTSRNKSKNRPKISDKLKYMKQNYQLYLFILPALILTILFKYVPMYGVLIAFKDFNVLKGIVGSSWVGFEHFQRFLTAPNFMDIFMSTLKLSVYGLLAGFPAPIILALMIHRVRSVNFKKNIQLVLYAPNFISGVVIVGMIFLFLSPVGPINKIINSLGGDSLAFMSDPRYFRSIYILSGIWQGIGWASIVYTAALSNVSQDLIDAAVIDGASIFKQILHIDLPTIKPIMVIQFILAAGGIMSIGFEKAFLMQTAMNITTSEIIPTYVYKLGLQRGDYSYSTAVGLFNSVINVILLLTVDKIVKKLNEGEGL